MATSTRELEDKLFKLKSSIDEEWLGLHQAFFLYLVVLVVVLRYASPSEMRCADAWWPILLVLLVTAGFSISFVNGVRRLVGLHEKLYAADCPDGENGDGRRTGWKKYAGLALAYLLLFAATVVANHLMLACF